MPHLIRRSASFLLRPSPSAMSRSGRTGTGSSKTTSTWTGHASSSHADEVSSRQAPVQSRVKRVLPGPIRPAVAHQPARCSLCDDVQVTDEVLADQVDYYRRRAGEYDATAYGD